MNTPAPISNNPTPALPIKKAVYFAVRRVMWIGERRRFGGGGGGFEEVGEVVGEGGVVCDVLERGVVGVGVGVDGVGGRDAL
jgi:hypothetical protein